MLCALLVRKPWNFSFEQIAQLTDEQIEEVVLRPANEEVSKRLYMYWPALDRETRRRKGTDDVKTFSVGGWKAMFWRAKTWQGAPPELIPELWQRWLERNPKLKPRPKRERIKRGRSQ